MGVGLALSSWALAPVCDAMPYYQCLCRGPDGAESQTCPITVPEGGVSGAYLAAAPVSELHSINGAQTVLCGDQVGKAVDPYLALIEAKGEDATHKYMKAIHDLSLQWISKSGQTRLAETAEVFSKGNQRPAIVGCVALMFMLLASIAYVKLGTAQSRGVACEGAAAALLNAEST